MNDFTDRLLETGLKEYSRVTPPDGLAGNIAATLAAKPPRRSRLAWAWMLAPAMACAAMVMMMRPGPLPTPPVMTFRPGPLPALTAVVGAKAGPAASNQPKLVAEVIHRRPRVQYRTLTAIELARLDFPAELLAPREDTPIADLTIKPLESANPPEGDKPNSKE